MPPPAVPSQRSHLAVFSPVWLIGLVALGVWSYWPTLTRTVEVWASNPDYSHGFLVPLLAGVLLWLRREEAPKAPRRRVDTRGLLALAGVMAIRALAGRFYLPELDAFTIPLWIASVVWLAAGLRTLKWATPALVLLAFAAPLPASVETSMGGALRTASAELSGSLLRAIGQPAITEGSIVLLGDQAFDVERACSGFRMFYGVLALAVATAALLRAPAWKATLLIVSAFPIALGANVVRIVLTGIFQRTLSGETAHQLIHDYAALLVLPLAAIALLAVAVLLGRLEKSFELEPAVRFRRYALLGTAAVAVVVGLAWLGLRMERLSAERLLAEAEAHLQQGEAAEGVEMLRRYTLLRPNDAGKLIAMGELIAQHDPTPDGRLRAFSYYERAWRLNPGDPDLALTTARAAYQVRRFRLSAEACSQLANTPDDQPGHVEAVGLRADALLASARGDRLDRESLHALRTAAALNPPATHHAALLADQLASQAVSAEDTAPLAEAEACLNRLVELRPSDPTAWLARSSYNRRLLKRTIGDTPTLQDRAASDLARALELNVDRSGPMAGGVYRAAAGVRFEDGLVEEGRDLLRRAIDADPTDYQAYLPLAESLAESDDEDSLAQAIAVLESGMASLEGLELSVAIRLASLYAQAGRFEESAETLNRVESAMPRIAPAQQGEVRLATSLVRARLEQASGGVAAALTRLQSAMRVGPSGAPSAQVWKQANERLGILLAATGWHDQAAQALLIAASIGPLDLESRQVLANSAALNGDLQLAESTYQALLVDVPGDAKARAALLDIAIRRLTRTAASDSNADLTSSWRDLERRLDRADRAGLPAPASAMLRASLQSAEGEAEAAVATLQTAFEKHPESIALLRSLAILRHGMGDQEGALADAERFAEVSEDANAPFFVVHLLIRQGDLDQAAKKLEQVLEDKPGSAEVDAHLLLAEIDLRREGPDAALEHLERAAAVQPVRLRALQTMAQLAAAEEDWERLSQVESRLYESEGESGVYWRLYAARRLLATTNDIDDPRFRQAARVADQLMRLRPGWGESHFLQAEIARRMGNFAIATESYVEAWRRGKRDVAGADRVLEGLVAQGQLREASAFLGEIRDLLTSAPRLFDRVAALSFNRDAAGRLLGLAEAWVARQPDSAPAHVRLGRALLVVGSSQADPAESKPYLTRARREFHEAVRLAPNDASTWAVATLLLAQASDQPTEISEVIASLAKEAPLAEPQRSLVYARVYQAIGNRRLAAAAFNDCLREIHDLSERGEAQTDQAAAIFAAAAESVVAVSPRLAERRAIEALRYDPQSRAGRVALARAQLHIGVAMPEALEPLSNEPAIDPRPIQLAWYRASGLAQDPEAAILLIESRLDLSRADRLMLAKLYEQDERLSSSLALLESLTDRADATPEEHEAFLAFWQRHFINETDQAFSRRAGEAYRALSRKPQRLAAWLRWKYREASRRLEEEDVSESAGAALIEEALGFADDASGVYAELLKSAIQEGAVTAALASAETPPAGLTLAEAVVALGQALTGTLPQDVLDSDGRARFDRMLTACGDDAGAWRSAGDYRLMTGDNAGACEAYEKVQQLAPNPAVSNNLAIAWAGREEGRDSALATRDESAALGSPADELADTGAWIELTTGDPAAALDRIRSIEPPILRVNPVYKLHHAMALSGLEEDDEAQQVLDEAIALGVEKQPLLPAEREALERLQRGAAASVREASTVASWSTPAGSEGGPSR